jgi:hypothetical protein
LGQYSKDSFNNLTGTVTVDYATKIVTGSATSFTTAGISTGDVLSFGTDSSLGEAVVVGVTSETQISIASTQFLSGAAIAGAAYTATQQPVYTLGVGSTLRGTLGGPSQIYGVDRFEVGLAATTTALGKVGAYAVAHSGWVSVAATYIDSSGNVRVKSEVLVAGGINTSFDADDDALFPDS